MKEELIGAVRKGNDATTTYFYLGVGNSKPDAIERICQRSGLKEKVELERVLCIAIESGDEPYCSGKYVGLAYRSISGQIILFSKDRFRYEYLKIYAQEVVTYYDRKTT